MDSDVKEVTALGDGDMLLVLYVDDSVGYAKRIVGLKKCRGLALYERYSEGSGPPYDHATATGMYDR
jgi:hypothetical protein